MQIIDVFVTRNAAEFVALGGDFSVGVVAEGARGTGGKRRLDQSPDGVPRVASDRTVFVLGGNPPPQRIVGKPPLASVRQGLFDQLTQAVPDEDMAAEIRVTDRQQLPVFIVVIVGDLAVRIGRFGDVALSIALVLPQRFAAIARVQETVAVFVGRRFVLRRNQRH
ncbi:hypothetical protein PS858_05685 [Pseudomonas fluorescens]|nr:hypothetical protein PS858_05685 [Pseudomonas fluorescens]